MMESLWLRQLRHFLPRDRIDTAHGVIVIPGFMGDDSYSSTFRDWLVSRGYGAMGWGQGTNRGPRPSTFHDLAKRINLLADKTGAPVSLIGHSLGGIYAREIAKDISGAVRQTISVGSPLGGEEEGRRKAPVSQIFSAFNPGMARHWERKGSIPTAPPVPTSTIFSVTDGVIGWKRSVQHDGHEQTENIAVFGSHGGMLHNAMVWTVLADRLRMEPGQWKPYEPSHALAGSVYVAPTGDQPTSPAN